MVIIKDWQNQAGPAMLPEMEPAAPPAQRPSAETSGVVSGQMTIEPGQASSETGSLTGMDTQVSDPCWLLHAQHLNYPLQTAARMASACHAALVSLMRVQGKRKRLGRPIAYEDDPCEDQSQSVKAKHA